MVFDILDFFYTYVDIYHISLRMAQDRCGEPDCSTKYLYTSTNLQCVVIIHDVAPRWVAIGRVPQARVDYGVWRVRRTSPYVTLVQLDVRGKPDGLETTRLHCWVTENEATRDCRVQF